jgi:hypothetical protein
MQGVITTIPKIKTQQHSHAMRTSALDINTNNFSGS